MLILCPAAASSTCKDAHCAPKGRRCQSPAPPCRPNSRPKSVEVSRCIPRQTQPDAADRHRQCTGRQGQQPGDPVVLRLVPGRGEADATAWSNTPASSAPTCGRGADAVQLPAVPHLSPVNGLVLPTWGRQPSPGAPRVSSVATHGSWGGDGGSLVVRGGRLRAAPSSTTTPVARSLITLRCRWPGPARSRRLSVRTAATHTPAGQPLRQLSRSRTAAKLPDSWARVAGPLSSTTKAVVRPGHREFCQPQALPG